MKARFPPAGYEMMQRRQQAHGRAAGAVLEGPPKLGTLDDWQAALVVAARQLAEGLEGEHVRYREPWAFALARVAADIMHEGGYGRPPGPAPEAWIKLAHEVARLPSPCLDGLVAAWEGMRLPISALPEPTR